MTNVLGISLLGRATISCDQRPVQLPSAKARALLYYLAATGQSHSRQALAGLLWGELPEADARRNLRVALLKLRREVAAHLLVTHQALAFDLAQPHWLDVAQFRQLITAPNGAPPPLPRLRQAVALYRGEFLEDFHVWQAPAFESWVMSQRIVWREQALAAYDALVSGCAEAGLLEEGVAHARRLLALDPAREEGHRQLMLLLARQGRRSAALAQYESCRHVLDQELNMAPAPETAALAERIRVGQVGNGERGRQPPRPARPPAPRPAATATGAGIAAATPFIAGPPVTDPRHFFGRQRELKRLFGLLRQPPLQNGAIIGPRRSGKTSLLHYLRQAATLPPGRLRPDQRQAWLPTLAHYRWVFVDFQDSRLGHQEALLQHLLAHMGLTVPEPCDLEQFLDVVTDELTTPAVVLLDEVSVALARYGELDDAFWDSLRSLATNQVHGRLGFVLGAAESPATLAQNNGLGSPFFNIFGYTAYLGPLAEAEALALIASAPRPFPDADVDWILAESGRWPLLLQILCRERLLSLEEGETGPDWRDDAHRQLAPFLDLKTA